MQFGNEKMNRLIHCFFDCYEYHLRGIDIRGLNSKKRPPTSDLHLAKVKEFLAKNGYTYPAYYDADGKITEGFNVEGFPFNMILDGDKVVKVIEGELTYEDLKENLLK